MSDRRRGVEFAALYFLMLVLAVAGQAMAGAYASDLHWPDEASHYVNGLLIHDYLKDGLPAGPLAYAMRYYVHFPKVAIGHWPPFFYGIEAAFFFLTGPSVHAALFLQAAMAALLAATAGYVVARLYGRAAGMAAALATLLAPFVSAGILGVMLDVPVALLAFAATLCWAKYLAEEKWPWSLLFALAAAAAILTKGNGFFLALLPPVSLLVTRRYRLLKRWSFWLPLPVTGVLTVPWYAMTYKIAADGFNYSWGLAFVAKALPAYGGMIFALIGIPGLLLAAAGAARVVRRRQTGWEGALGAAALSAVLAGFAYHCLVPVAIEVRYLVPLVPDLVILAFAALRWNEEIVPPRRRLAAAAVAVLALFGGEVRFHSKSDLGMGDAARIAVAGTPANPFILAGSTPGGEGAITAAAASLDRARTHYILRGFQVLGSGNFMGTVYRARFATPDAMRRWIEDNGIGWVVLDTSPDSLAWAHNRQLKEIIDARPAGWQRAARLPGRDGPVVVYRITANFGRKADVARLLPALLPKRIMGRAADK